MEQLGHTKMVLKSDQEPAILALKRAVARRLPRREIIMEESPATGHQANGEAEAAVRELGKQIRVMKGFVEKKYNKELPTRHPLLAWLVRYAGQVITRLAVGRDGY